MLKASEDLTIAFKDGEIKIFRAGIDYENLDFADKCFVIKRKIGSLLYIPYSSMKCFEITIRGEQDETL